MHITVKVIYKTMLSITRVRGEGSILKVIHSFQKTKKDREHNGGMEISNKSKKSKSTID